jgi:GDP-mannose 6-dehydrogenase
MNVSIFGMGYVGAVTAACLAARGHRVVGIDPNRTKLDLINSGVSPLVEEDLPELFGHARAGGFLTGTDIAREAVLDSDISLVCVGTPSRANGSLDDKYLVTVSRQIGEAVREKTTPHTVVYRSTMVPGLVDSVLIPLLETVSGKREGRDFHVCVNPEFLREGTSIFDFFNPPKTVIGAEANGAAEAVLNLYRGLSGPTILTTRRVAEMVKYTDNAFHALKITFANEIGQLCKSLDIDSHKVMEIFIRDTKLNISKAYLQPGFAFGGSCLPKDLRALTHLARTLDVETPLLSSVLESNRKLVDKAVSEIIALEKHVIGFAGISFKAGTDDLRESPVLEVVERLIGKGYDVSLYDRHVSMARLVGANKDYLQKTIPHVTTLMVPSLDHLLQRCEVVVIGNRDRGFEDIPRRRRAGQIIYDLVRITAGGEYGQDHLVFA